MEILLHITYWTYTLHKCCDRAYQTRCAASIETVCLKYPNKVHAPRCTEVYYSQFQFRNLSFEFRLSVQLLILQLK